MPIIGTIASSYRTAGDTTAFIAASYTGASYTTTDGVAWTFINASRGYDRDLFGYQDLGAANDRIFINNYGVMRVSTNGTTWTDEGTQALTMSNIRYLNGAYWQATTNVQTSTDGVRWTTPTVGVYGSFYSIAYGGGIYVAVGYGTFGIVYTSTNGTTWTSRSISSTLVCYDVAYGSSRFVIGGYLTTGNSDGRIAYSSDGITWTLVSTGLINPSGYIYGIITNGTNFVTPAYNSTRANYSTDGITWNNYALGTTESNWNGGCYYANGYYVLPTNGQPTNGILAYSTNGTTWSTTTFGYTSPMYQIRYAHNKWYGNLNNAYGSAGSKSGYITSTNLTTWTLLSEGRKSGWTWGRSLIKYNNTYYTTSDYPSDGLLWLSTDGTTWSTRTIGWTSGGGTGQQLMASANLWIATTDNGAIYTSTDGITWTSRTNPNAGSSNYSVATLPTATYPYVIGQQSGSLIYSTNGTTWTSIVGGSNTYWAGIAALGLYIFGGNNGQISTSTDGSVWTTRTSQFGTSQIRCFATNGTIVVAAGGSGKISTSTDGITWTTRTSNITSTIYNMKWTSSFGFITSPQNPGSTQYNEYATSTDGITWTSRTLPTTLNSFYGIA